MLFGKNCKTTKNHTFAPRNHPSFKKIVGIRGNFFERKSLSMEKTVAFKVGGCVKY
jgi:hypothetical protein